MKRQYENNNSIEAQKFVQQINEEREREKLKKDQRQYELEGEKRRLEEAILREKEERERYE